MLRAKNLCQGRDVETDVDVAGLDYSVDLGPR